MWRPKITPPSYFLSERYVDFTTDEYWFEVKMVYDCVHNLLESKIIPSSLLPPRPLEPSYYVAEGRDGVPERWYSWDEIDAIKRKLEKWWLHLGIVKRIYLSIIASTPCSCGREIEGFCVRGGVECVPIIVKPNVIKHVALANLRAVSRALVRLAHQWEIARLVAERSLFQRMSP